MNMFTKMLMAAGIIGPWTPEIKEIGSEKKQKKGKQRGGFRLYRETKGRRHASMKSRSNRRKAARSRA